MEVISGVATDSVSFLGFAAFKVPFGVPGSTIIDGMTNAVGLGEGATLATGVSLGLVGCSSLGFCKFANSFFDTHFHHFLEFSKSNLT